MRTLLIAVTYLLMAAVVTAQQKDFCANCQTDFWTVDGNGDIQQWSLIDGTITGGEIVLTGSRSSLAYCGDGKSPDFYCGNWPGMGISYYDTATPGWITIPTEFPVINNGASRKAQYYMRGGLQVLYYFDGTDLIEIESFDSQVKLYDIPVDASERAWIFTGSDVGDSAERLEVYDKNGLVEAYGINFNSIGTYGAFFLNDVLYVGMLGQGAYPNSLVSVVIEGDSAYLGTAIPFEGDHLKDMASCQEKIVAHLPDPLPVPEFSVLQGARLKGFD